MTTFDVNPTYFVLGLSALFSFAGIILSYNNQIAIRIKFFVVMIYIIAFLAFLVSLKT